MTEKYKEFINSINEIYDWLQNEVSDYCEIKYGSSDIWAISLDEEVVEFEIKDDYYDPRTRNVYLSYFANPNWRSDLKDEIERERELTKLNSKKFDEVMAQKEYQDALKIVENFESKNS